MARDRSRAATLIATTPVQHRTTQAVLVLQVPVLYTGYIRIQCRAAPAGGMLMHCNRRGNKR